MLDAQQHPAERRAQAVASYLSSRGVNSARVRWAGYGENQLKIATGDGVNEPMNRRVEIKILPLTQAEIDAAR